MPPTLKDPSGGWRAARYFILVLAFGALYTPWVLASYGLFPEGPSTAFLVLGGLSPTFAALAVVTIEYGRRGPGLLLRQFLRRGFSGIWLVVAILVPFATSVPALVVWRALGETYALDPVRLTAFPTILIAVFVANMWEEVGWRGYALPILQGGNTALVSSAVVAVFWAAWHWPLFAVKDSVMAVNFHGFLGFAAWLLPASVSYTWLYNSTKGSLLVVSLYHATINAVNSLLFYDGRVSQGVFPYYLVAMGVLALALVVTFKPRTLAHWEAVTFGPSAEG